VGDCGVRIVRQGRVVFQTAPQQHDFNLPYQLSHPRMFPQTDTADNADVYSPQVQRGDIVLLGSDGLLDNVWDVELARVVGGWRRGRAGGLG
jgi:protein phosphatase PTC7